MTEADHQETVTMPELHSPIWGIATATPPRDRRTRELSDRPLYIAGIGSRLAAAAIDVSVNGAITFFLLFSAASAAAVDPTGQTPAPTGGALLASALIACFYVVRGLHRRGATLGMRILNLRIVHRRTRALPTVGQALARFVLTWGLTTPALIGLLIAGLDRDHRSWYDHVTGTVVIRV